MSESKTSQKRLEAANRQRQALELRARGVGFAKIADELGYKSASGAFRAVAAGLRKTLQEPAATLRVLEVERLGRLETVLWARLPGNISVADKLLRVWERRARLLGLDAPNKLEITRLLESQEAVQLRAALWDALADWPEARDKVDVILGGLASE